MKAGVDGNLPAGFLFLIIHHRAAVVYLAEPVDFSSGEEHSFGKRGFTAITMTDDCNISYYICILHSYLLKNDDFSMLSPNTKSFTSPAFQGLPDDTLIYSISKYKVKKD
jgi:hypothetical protein